ncbi:MAG: DNA sulfur modification protein DndD [Gammaproteobacteria bacterium]|nr:DNA sulfur modification protein DndD [Gammaproteobacteria bacterium]
MILDSITLENFGLYAGRQEIILTPPSTQKPIVLFGGLNGGGKTTLLDALQLGLFGQHAKTSNRGRLSYAEYLSRCIHVHEGYNFASVSLRFRHTIQGNEDHYTLKRRWERNKKGCNEVFDVLKNGRLAPDLSENWPSQVDVLMPLNIAHLFLFDGEKIERYASPSESANLVGTAIQNLLGLDVVNQLDRDIRVLERRKKLELSDNISRLRISEIEDAQKKLRDRITAAKQKRAAIRTHEIGKRLRQLDMAEREFRRLGGDLYERSKEFEVALRDADDVLSERSEALCEAASGALPLLLVTDLLRSGAERDLEDAEITKALQMHDLLVSRDTAVLKFLKSMGVEIGLLNQTKKFLDNDRANHRQRGDRKISLDLDKETRGEITVLLHGGLDDALKSASERLEHYQNAESEIEGLRAIRDSIPEEETIQGVIQKRNNLKEEVEALEAKDARLAGEINLLERERERGRRKIEMLYVL